MSETNRFFLKECLCKFDFLIKEFNYEVMAKELNTVNPYVSYCNKVRSVGVVVNYEYGQNYVYVFLFKVINKENPQWDDPKNIIDLNQLASNPESLNLPIHYPELYSEKDLSQVLQSHADALRKYAKEILKGDLMIFTEFSR